MVFADQDCDCTIIDMPLHLIQISFSICYELDWAYATFLISPYHNFILASTISGITSTFFIRWLLHLWLPSFLPLLNLICYQDCLNIFLDALVYYLSSYSCYKNYNLKTIFSSPFMLCRKKNFQKKSEGFVNFIRIWW